MGDDLAWLLATRQGDLLKALGVLALDTDEDRQLRVGVALVYLDLLGSGVIELSVEVAGLGIGVRSGIFVHIN